MGVSRAGCVGEDRGFGLKNNALRFRLTQGKTRKADFNCHRVSPQRTEGNDFHRFTQHKTKLTQPLRDGIGWGKGFNVINHTRSAKGKLVQAHGSDHPAQTDERHSILRMILNSKLIGCPMCRA
jgi:hypothetical protein